MKKAIKETGNIYGIVLFAAILTFNIAMYVSNDLTAKKVQDMLIGIPLPEHTEYIEKNYKAGKLDGCGNGMQYWGAILIKSELSAEELKKYYSDNAQNGNNIFVKQQNGKGIEDMSQLSFTSTPDSNDYYAVYTYCESNNPLFKELDLRGH